MPDPSDSTAPPADAEPVALGEAISPAPKDEPTAKKAGRGGLAIAAAKVYFILAGLIQQIALNHILGTQGYGALSRVQSLASMVYNPIVSTAVQWVSRSVAGSSAAERPLASSRHQRPVLAGVNGDATALHGR